MEIIQKYFTNLTETQIEQFAKLQELYQDWNLKINVVSRKDIDELYLPPCITFFRNCQSDGV